MDFRKLHGGVSILEVYKNMAVTKSGTGLGDRDAGKLGLEDVINKQPDFCAEFVKYNFWRSSER